jgi:hypothetical protein
LVQDKKKTLIKLLKNSIGTNFFKNNYFFDSGKSKDILKNGRLSCAFYVSTILKILNLIKDIHLTVNSTIKDMEENGWYKVKNPKKGSIVVWEKKEGHYHIGFYWNKKLAVSNNTSKKTPTFHPLNFKNRKILFFYSHKDIE